MSEFELKFRAKKLNFKTIFLFDTYFYFLFKWHLGPFGVLSIQAKLSIKYTNFNLSYSLFQFTLIFIQKSLVQKNICFQYIIFYSL